LNDITVLVQSEDGTEITGRTVNGQVALALEDFQIGSNVTISLPQYFRSEIITVPAQGSVPVTFIFEQPTLPTAIP